MRRNRGKGSRRARPRSDLWKVGVAAGNDAVSNVNEFVC